MKVTTPEISWHNRDPIYSVDIQPATDGIRRLASCGTDKYIRIWSLSKNSNKTKQNVEYLSTLARHQKTVNVVRFSPDGGTLASGGDDSFVILWRISESSSAFPFEEEDDSKEKWSAFKVFRSHLEDVYDISWSSDGLRLVSGSVDNTAIVWDVKKGCKLCIYSDHKSFVQGVAYDPLGEFLVTMSCDRSMRVYLLSNDSLVHDVRKICATSKSSRMFHDDAVKSFFRRLSFSPDGKLLVVPSGCLELDGNSDPTSTTFIFLRGNLSKPVAHLPLPPSCKTSLAVRFCPKLFKLWDARKNDNNEEELPAGIERTFLLPYRMVFAVITDTSVVLYDTQFNVPFAFVSNTHYHTLSDISWSDDGLILMVSSTDGYCTVVSFEEGELGEVYAAEKPTAVVSEGRESTASDDVAVVQVPVKTVSNESKEVQEVKVQQNRSQTKQPRRVAVTTLRAD